MKRKNLKGKSSKQRNFRRGKESNHLAYAAIAMFFVFAFLLGFVNVGEQTGHVITGNDALGTPNGVDISAESSFLGDIFGNIFETWNEGKLDLKVAKYFLFAIVTFFIFSALNFAKVPESNVVQWLISIPVAFLAVAYITPSELFTLLTSFSALGLTLSTIIPFIILLFFSAMMLSNEHVKSMTVAKVMFEVTIWWFFSGYLLFRLVDLFWGENATAVAGGTTVEASPTVAWIMGILFFVSIFILMFNKRFRGWIRNLGNELREAKADVVGSEARGGRSLIDPEG